MSFAFDEDLVLAKVSIVRQCVRTIRVVRDRRDAGLEPWIARDVMVLNLQRAIQALVDLANHLLAENDLGLPRSAGEAFGLLAERGVVSSGEAALARAMVGFRNVAVHQYRELRGEILEGIVTERLADLDGLATTLLAATLGTDPPAAQ